MDISSTNGRSHIYNAKGAVIEGHLHLPLEQQIKPQASLELPEHGGYLTQRMENYRLESVISIRSGYTQVAGNRSPKSDEGWSTLTTVVVEGLNVLEVVTADRIVGQIITDHPLEGHVPTISFLGTRFENLRIAGEPVKLDLNLGILGPKPEGDKPYGSGDTLKKNVRDQYNRILAGGNLPADKLERYNRLSSTLGSREEVECSLVNQASGDYPGPSFGHLIHIPLFGWISLGRVHVSYKEVEENGQLLRKTTVHLTMVELFLGCMVEGMAGIGGLSSNGSSEP